MKTIPEDLGARIKRMAHEKKNAQFSARISRLEAEMKTTLEHLAFLTKVPRIKSVGGGKKGVNKSI